jgi:uncharacterized protein YqhQ
MASDEHAGDAPVGDPGVPSEPVLYGGQAVMEGVMMRGQRSWSVAVRRPTDDIYVETRALRPLAARNRLFRLPFFRGIGVLADSMSIGVRALAISGHQSLGEEDQISQKQMNWSLGIGALFFSVVFILLPATGTNWLSSRIPNHFWFNVVEGVVRLGFFLGYIALISRMRDIRRVFEYHGAEHMTIHCYEAKLPINVDNVSRFPTLHVRCGTNFLLLLFATMLVVFTFAFSFIGRPPLLLRVGLHLAAVPLITGIAYEFIRLGAGREHSPLVRAIMKPGLWLQMITTKPPSEDQIEVAIRAFEYALPEHERSIIEPLPTPVVLAGDAAPETPPGTPSEGDESEPARRPSGTG